MDPRAATNKLRVPFFKLARGITRATLAYPAIMIGFYTHTQNRDSDTLRLAYPLAENRTPKGAYSFGFALFARSVK